HLGHARNTRRRQSTQQARGWSLRHRYRHDPGRRRVAGDRTVQKCDDRSMKLYAHPFSSYSQKVLIALYENGTTFEYRSLEEAEANAELAALWPLKRFPVLVDQGKTIVETSTIIEYLQNNHPGAVRLIPEGDVGIEARMLERVFDNYVMTPVQKIVFNQIRQAADRDAFGVTEA